MKAVLYLQICDSPPWPKPVFWLEELKNEVDGITFLELDNFSSSQLTGMAGRFASEATCLAIVIQAESDKAGIGNLLGLLQIISKTPVKKKVLTLGKVNLIISKQLSALGYRPEVFSIQKILHFLSLNK